MFHSRYFVVVYRVFLYVVAKKCPIFHHLYRGSLSFSMIFWLLQVQSGSLALKAVCKNFLKLYIETNKEKKY